MKDKAKVIWTGPERFLPGIGMARMGLEIDGPKELLDNYVRQGLAKRQTLVMSKLTEETEK